MENPIRLGQLSVSLALVLALAGCVAAVAAARSGGSGALGAARNAMLANAALLTLGCATLLRAFLVSDFSVAYVAQNSNLDLPLLYKLTAMWSAHEGSLLLWAWYLAAFSAGVVLIHWRSDRLAMPWVIFTLGAVQAGFLAFILFLSNPFSRLTPVPADGQSLNPLLQDPGLAFHPPVLYLGYVGFVVPFAFAIAALIRGYEGLEWVRAVRGWTLFAWTALTSGIVLGGFWAYYELGWGGYWAWDPVENASLMPWLAGTALLHSMMVQDRRGAFRLWNLFLVVTTFVLTLLGAFLVRSGVLTSVHTFAVDPARGAYMLGFLVAAMVAGYGLILWRADRQPEDNVIESPLSREAAILANNVVLVLAMVIVLAGTLAPLAVEVFSRHRISVGAPYYNAVVTPLLAGLLFLMAMGPTLPWRRMPPARFAARLAPAAATGAVAGLFVLALGAGWLGVLAGAAAGFAAVASLRDGFDAIRARRRTMAEGWLVAAARTLRGARRRIGGLVAHLGVALMAAGMVASGPFQSGATVLMRPGQAVELAGHRITLDRIADAATPNYAARRAEFTVVPPGGAGFAMEAERRFYLHRRMATTQIGLDRRAAGDLHLIMGDETADGGLVMQLWFNPLVWVVWLGWLVMVSGAVLALGRAGRRAEVAAPRAVPLAGSAPGGAP